MRTARAAAVRRPFPSPSIRARASRCRVRSIAAGRRRTGTCRVREMRRPSEGLAHRALALVERLVACGRGNCRSIRVITQRLLGLNANSSPLLLRFLSRADELVANVQDHSIIQYSV